MKKVIIHFVLYGLLFAAGACTDNLKLNPVSQISNASFWKTEEDANGALYGMYVRMRDQMASNYFKWGEARSETMAASSGGSAGNEIYYQNMLTRTNSGPTWQGMYTIIHDANLLLKYVPGIPFKSEATRNQLLAQARTMRAFVYFTMVKTWGDLPLVTEPTEGYDPLTTQKERSSRQQVFDLIKNDLAEAEKLFGPAAAYTTGRFLWSKPALLALKADVFLWTGKQMNGGQADFTVALAALEEVEKSDVQLLQDYRRIFDYDNKGNKEIVMAVRYEDIEAGDTEYQNMYSYPGLTPGNLDAATKEALGVLGGFSVWSPSQTVRSQFTADDQRKNASFIEMYTVESNGARNYYSSVVSKFNGVVINGVRRFLDDVIIYRYADILLLKAEAKNALGQDPSAEINKVRQRAYGAAFSAHTYVNDTRENNDKAILKERLLELAFEGKRWWDLVRFGKAFELVPSLKDRAGQDYLLLFPISETTLSLEPKVQQNPGYN